MSTNSDIVFNGTTGASASHFIRLVRQEALQQNRSKDDEWTAEFAASCLEDAALVWFESQSAEIQESWRLLRRALLERWPPETSEVEGSSGGQ